MIPPSEYEFDDLIHKNLKENLITFCRQNQPTSKKIPNSADSTGGTQAV
jgi:hypothetical protein